jgi:integrase
VAKNKRANGEGSIYQRKDGRWVGQYTFTTPDGQKKRGYVYAGTREEARVKLTKAIAERDGGPVYDAGKLTLGDHVERWLRHSVRDSVKPITHESYSSLARNHIVPALGRIRLKDLTPDHVRAFRASKLEAGLSRRTVRYLLVLLRQALGQAVEDGLLPSNVAQGVKVKQIGDEEEVRYLSPQQAKALLAAAREDRLEALYVLAVHTGLRQGELLALRWADVDLAAGRLSVRRTLSSAKGGSRFTAPKTAKSRRMVKLTGARPWTPSRATGRPRRRRGPGWVTCGMTAATTSCSAPRRGRPSTAATSRSGPSSRCWRRRVSPTACDSTTSGTPRRACCSPGRRTPRWCSICWATPMSP